jgi:HAUS augmin-like complex subunit 1
VQEYRAVVLTVGLEKKWRERSPEVQMSFSRRNLARSHIEQGTNLAARQKLNSALRMGHGVGEHSGTAPQAGLVPETKTLTPPSIHLSTYPPTILLRDCHTTATTMAHLSPSAIFSPSVARQQLAAAKDWNYIDSWLSTKFNGKTPPPFERNNDTLKALLALTALNETADEERDLLARVEAKALQDLRAREEVDPNAQLLISVEESLTREGQTSLEALSTMSVTLNRPIPDVEQLGRSIIDLQVSASDLDQASERVSVLETHLNNELETINALIKDLQSDAYQPSSDLPKQAIDYQRKMKALVSKLPELKDRVTSLSASLGNSKVTVQDVQAEENKFQHLLAVVKDLEIQVKSYHGLPQDTDLARFELESVRGELQDLTRQRDSMFEGLVERETPRKTRS